MTNFEKPFFIDKIKLYLKTPLNEGHLGCDLV